MYLKIVKSLLTAEQCRQLITQAENLGFEPVDRGIAQYGLATNRDDKLAELLENEVRGYLPDFYGGAQVVGVSNFFRFSKYQPGGRFGMHRDGLNQHYDGTYNAMTLNIFLNDDFTGGSTVFYNDNENKITEAVPQTGTGSIFDINYLHEGELVKTGYKYLLRTDIHVKKICPQLIPASEEDRDDLLIISSSHLK